MGPQDRQLLRRTLDADLDSSAHTQSHNFTGRASNFEAHNLARHTLSLGFGRNLWPGSPYSMNAPINILVDQ
jgi:hypothetical protein